MDEDMFSNLGELIAHVSRTKEQLDILNADLDAEFAQLRAAMTRLDQTKVEEIRARIHNVIDLVIDLRWSTAISMQKFKRT